MVQRKANATMETLLIKLFRSSAQNVTFSQLVAQVEAELGRNMFTSAEVRNALLKLVKDRLVTKKMDDDVHAYRYKWNGNAFMNEDV